MKQRNPKQQLNISVDQTKNYNEQLGMISHSKKNQIQRSQQPQQVNLQNSAISSNNKRDELKKVQNDIQTMKNKIYLLKQQLKKQQDMIKSHKSKTQQIIKKKINVNKIQRYKQKDNSLDVERSQLLRIRNASLRQAHQSEMQNILKAIYLVKLDDARQIKEQSKNFKIKIKEMNDSIWSQQIQKKKKVAEESQKAKQRYQKYWREKLASLYQNQVKGKQEIQKLVVNKKDELKELREEQIKLLQSMNKIQSKQLQSKKQYLAALSLPVRDIADALNRSRNNIENSQQSSVQKLNRMQSDLTNVRKSKSSMDYNYNGLSLMEDSLLRNSSVIAPKKLQKIPKSTVNQDKLKVILKQLKRLQRSEKNKSVLS